MQLFSKKILGGLTVSLSLIACNNQEQKNENVQQITENEKPNFLLILVDDMGFSDLGCMGSEISTSNIDKLSNDGITLTQFYNCGRSCPSRASLLTGLYQHEAGIGDMIDDLGFPSYQGYLNDSCVTIAEVLKTAGYQTFMSGKWHVGSHPDYWPLKRGFDRFFGFPKGGGVYFYPFAKDRSVILDDKKTETDSTFYSTDAFTEYACKFLAEANKSDKPFFLYLPHIAPHFPLQAHPEDIAKYRGKYKDGFAKIRQARFKNLKQQGLIPENVKLSNPDEQVLNWEKLTEEQKDEYDLRMAIYAAQIECLDRNIGIVMDKLQEIGELDNTVIFFMSDNGGTHEDLSKNHKEFDGELGTVESYRAYSRSWANVSNTPFRMYKHWVHEGGISSPLIVRYPKLIRKNQKDYQVAHINDIMPTILELAQTVYPDTFNEKPIKKLRGQSLVPLLKGETIERERPIFWEHEGNRAVRKGDWKLVSKFPENNWELYNIPQDRMEENDLSAEKPKLVKELSQLYDDWAKSANVIPRELILEKRKK